MAATYLYLAPAAAGKTAYAIRLARQAARDLQAEVRVCVPTSLQLDSWHRRLAEAGGAIGVRVFTFDQLVVACLDAAAAVYTELSDPVQYRLLRAVVDQLPLDHYASLVTKPGFIQVLQALIGELKAAQVTPQAFAAAVAALDERPRLQELAQVYEAYQAHLQAQKWADRAGMSWLAAETLAQHAPHVGRHWLLLIVDGFDSFTTAQLALLQQLAQRVDKTVITLTGSAAAPSDAPHQRFQQTREQLETWLNVTAQPLPQPAATTPLYHLAARLFDPAAEPQPIAPALTLIEAPDRPGEVRAALRWLKARLVEEDTLSPRDVALLARNMEPYRPFVRQTAAEFGLPLRLVAALPLRKNPAIAALMDLLRLLLPDGNGRPALPRRLVVAAWRSPYFDWSISPSTGAPAIDILPGDADKLDSIARHGRVIHGIGQWQEALQAAAGRAVVDEEDVADMPHGIHLPSVAEARRLQATFNRFWQQLMPPATAVTMRDFVRWLETLIGADPVLLSSPSPPPLPGTTLNVVTRVRAAGGRQSEAGIAALRALKDVLRGLVWAEEVLPEAQQQPVDFARFFNELSGAVEAAGYRPSLQPDREAILVADVIQARGLPFQAVAVLGLAEGEFPAAIREDPFLRDSDRAALRHRFGLPLDPSTQSAEQEFFYETVTRAASRLLLTRPRLADTGAAWVASPFWEEMRRLTAVTATSLTSETIPPPHQAASWPELLESMVTYAPAALQKWVQQHEPDRLAALTAASQLLHARHQAQATPYDGDLTHMAAEFARRFRASRPWSASRLEQYRTCAYFFFVSSVLWLEPRLEPEEGLDARQLGNIYHHIFETAYRHELLSSLVQAQQELDPETLRPLVAEVATPILDAAPSKEGFRQTPWWQQTRAEMIDHVTASIIALAQRSGDFVPLRTEARFWDAQDLVVRDGDDRFRVHGFIDRVDRDANGRLRIIDYKLGGPSAFSKRQVAEGKKLQLPLYALAAREALELGEIADGFYWHFRQVERSPFTLAGFDGGVEAALETAVAHAWTAVRGARRGHFVPQPPAGGCPSYCPAAAFCWHYTPGFGG